MKQPFCISKHLKGVEASKEKGRRQKAVPSVQLR